MEERIGKRINVDRVDEALGTAPTKIATGCPFCRVMLNDGITQRKNDGLAGEHVEVIDVAQLLLSSVKRKPAPAPLPEPEPELVIESSAPAAPEPGQAREAGGEAERNGHADLPTDEVPNGTPLAEQDSPAGERSTEHAP